MRFFSLLVLVLLSSTLIAGWEVEIEQENDNPPVVHVSGHPEEEDDMLPITDADDEQGGGLLEDMFAEPLLTPAFSDWTRDFDKNFESDWSHDLIADRMGKEEEEEQEQSPEEHEDDDDADIDDSAEEFDQPAQQQQQPQPKDQKAALAAFGKMFAKMATAMGVSKGAVVEKQHQIEKFFTKDVYKLTKQLKAVQKDKSLSKAEKAKKVKKIQAKLAAAMKKAFGGTHFKVKWQLPVIPLQPSKSSNKPSAVHKEKWVTKAHGMHCVHKCKQGHSAHEQFKSCVTTCH